MRTNIEIDDELLQKVQKSSGIKTKKALVEKALQLMLITDNQRNLINLWGKVELDDKAYL